MSFAFNVNGTLIVPAAYVVNGTGPFKLNGSGVLEVANASGINGAIVTTGIPVFSPYADYVFNGTVPQVTGMYLPTSLILDTVTISNAAGVTLILSTATTGQLAFTSGILYTTLGLSFSTPGTPGAVIGAGATSYVDGELLKTITGLTSVNYEVGDLDYAPMSLTFSGAGTAGSIGVTATNGLHPSVATSGLSTSNMANHYWTIDNSSASGPATITPTATYNSADIIGGTNASFQTQEYASAAWLGAALATTNTSTPYTSTPNTGIALATVAGDYIFGNIACGTLPITGTPTLCTGTTTALSDATTGGAWSSSGTGVATVSGGVVTGVSTGTATISYTAAGCTSTLVVTVGAAPVAGTISGVNVACIGLTTTLTDGVPGGVWSSSATGIATVSGGVVTGVAAGNVIISYTVTNSCGSATATMNVTVSSTLTVGPILGTDSVCVGHTTALSDATTGGAWSSMTPSIATVSGTGIVTGVAVGYDSIVYTVTNSCGTASAKVRVKVRAASASCGTFVGNNEPVTAELKIFPNPNTGTFSVNLASDIDETIAVVITNIVGEKVKEFSATTNKTTDVQLNCAPGIYLVSAFGTNGRYVGKIIVE